MNNQEPISTCIRTVGHLLLAHPTTGKIARDWSGNYVPYFDPQAECFCFVGACCLVEDTFDPDLEEGLSSRCAKVLGDEFDDTHRADSWDSATDAQRTEWANKLANYKENV